MHLKSSFFPWNPIPFYDLFNCPEEGMGLIRLPFHTNPEHSRLSCMREDPHAGQTECKR